MCQQEDKCNLLLKKIAKLDDELFELLEKDNSIDDIVFCKIDNTLYRTQYKPQNGVVCWYGYQNGIQKFLRTYHQSSPIYIYIYIDEITHEIIELEFLDWENKICEVLNSCIDFLLNSKIKIEYST